MTNEELEQEVKRLEEQITNLRIKLLESKTDKKTYEVEVPKDIEDYYYIDETGLINELIVYDEDEQKEVYKRGLAFKTKEEAKQFDKERILIKKLKDRAKEYNGGWEPNWNDLDENKHSVTYDYDENKFRTKSTWYEDRFSKLPWFISYDIAQQFVEEFKEEIIEVLC